MVLRDAAGLVVDSLNYGGLVDPWAAEGYQAASGAGRAAAARLRPARAAVAVSADGAVRPPARPIGARAASRTAPTPTATARDFLVQTATTLSADSAAGANNIKVASVADFSAGQTIMIDSGANRETAVIATVGTAGGTTVGTATDVGATVIPVASAMGFSAGQTITIDSGANHETAVVASITGGGRGGFGGGQAALAAPQSPSPRRSRLRTRRVRRSPAPASPSPLH